MKHVIEWFNEWTSYKDGTMQSTFHAPLAENKQPTITDIINQTKKRMKNEESNVQSILAGCPDDALPTNEEVLAEDITALIQNELRKSGIVPKRGLDEKLLRGTILWYTQTSMDGK